MGKKSYKVGSVSQILASGSTEQAALDQQLCDIFASSTFKRLTTAAAEASLDLTEKSPKKGKKESPLKIKKEKKAEDVVPSHTDVAAIRVKSKRKFTDESLGEDNSPTKVKEEQLQPKKKKKKDKKVIATVNSEQGVDEVGELPDISEVTEGKTKKKKNKQKGGAKLTLTKVDKKLKGKKAKKTKKVLDEEGSSDEDEDELSKVPEDIDSIIKKFEKEQNGEGSDDDTDDEEKKAEAEDTKPKNLKHFELNKPKDKNDESEARTIFVGNLATSTKDKSVKKLFKQFGKIESIRFRGAVPIKPYLLKKVALNQKKLNPDLYSISAYVRFETRESAEKAAAEMNGHALNQHFIVVDLADNKKRDNKKAIFIGNIPLKVQDDHLRNFFLECGDIESVRIIRDSSTGLSKGFGYVNFKQSDSIEVALKKNGEDFEGRPLRIARAVKKEKVTKAGKDGKPNSKFSRPGSGPQNVPQKGGFQGKGIPPKGGFQGGQSTFPKGGFQGNRAGALRRLDKKSKPSEFTGDKLAEIGKLKRKSNKPNKGELRKAKIAAQLTGVSTTQIKKFNKSIKK